MSSQLPSGALASVLSHLKRSDDLKIGTQNRDDLDGQSYANMTAAAFDKLLAQGDLRLKEMPDSEFLTSEKRKDWRPIHDAEMVQYLDCENYSFSDSVLKLGKK